MFPGERFSNFLNYFKLASFSYARPELRNAPCDKLSAQFLLALPNKYYFLEPTAFSDTLARYLGAPLPSIVRGGLGGLPMPCNALSGGGRRKGRVCDVHGHQMELAKLRDNTVCVESTTLEKAIHETLRHAGFDSRWQDKTMFKATRVGGG